MNILFFYTGEPSPIFETQLELIKKHAVAGDKVLVLICDGKPENCFWNPEKLKYVCTLCNSKRKNGFDILNDYKNIDYKYLSNFKINENYKGIKNIEVLKNINYDNVNIGIGIASRIISLYRDHRVDLSNKIVQLNKEILSTIQVYENLKKNITEFQPDLLYIFNGRASAYLAATHLCKKLNINYFTYEVAYTPNRYLLRKDCTSHNIDAFHEEMELLWNSEKNINKKEIESRKYFEKKRYGQNLFKVERFTIDQKLGKLPSSFDNKFINIAIFNSTIDEYAAVEGWENTIYFPDETSGIKQIVDSFQNNDKFRFYLRVHPNMRKLPKTTSQLADLILLSEQYTNLYIIWPEEEIDSYELMISCNKVITFTSTIGIESAYWGKPTIIAGHSLYEKLECVYRPKTHDELINLVQNIELPPLNGELALKYAYRELNHGIDFKYFKEIGFKNNLAIGKFCGIQIKPSFITRINFYFNIALNKFISKIKKLNYDF